MIVQAGAFGEHQFVSADYAQRTSDYPGISGSSGYAAPELQMENQTITINNHLLRLQLPPAHEIRLRLEVKHFVNTPSYQLPWERLSL